MSSSEVTANVGTDAEDKGKGKAPIDEPDYDWEASTEEDDSPDETVVGESGVDHESVLFPDACLISSVTNET
jgi:hypothetical protein